jgi:hypothetical protein
MERIIRFGQLLDPGIQPEAVAYRPGVCNIGRAEIAQRRAFGVGVVLVAVVILVVLLAIGAPPLARVLVLPFLWAGLVSLEQARRRFCVAFAYVGIRSMDDAHETGTVGDAEDSARDRRAARRMILECGVVAVAITALLVLLPV